MISCSKQTPFWNKDEYKDTFWKNRRGDPILTLIRFLTSSSFSKLVCHTVATWIVFEITSKSCGQHSQRQSGILSRLRYSITSSIAIVFPAHFAFSHTMFFSLSTWWCKSQLGQSRLEITHQNSYLDQHRIHWSLRAYPSNYTYINKDSVSTLLWWSISLCWATILTCV
jgi:hypothetical protein